MAPSWFLILLKCIDFLSWPVLALGYPLYASIEVIENDNHSDTRNLISYWILLSLIYLFEYAFLKLLRWFKYWHYMKLMIVAFLMTPDFGRAAYVYNRLIRSCIYMNPQAVISRFRSFKNIFVNKEDFIKQAEKYITQNGTEALEKLIASKNTEPSLHVETRKVAPTTTEKNEILKNTEPSLNAQTRKAVPITEKNEILKTNKERLFIEQKDIKDLEMIEKEEVPEGKQANAVLDTFKSNESTLSSMVKTQKMPANMEHGTHPKISASENVQKEWTCAICQLSLLSEANLNSHLEGRKHKAACEALNTKSKVTSMIDTGTGASPQVNTCINEQTQWTCDICEITVLSEANFKSHLQGKKHKNIIQQNKDKYVDANSKVQELNKEVGVSVGTDSCSFRCDVCNVSCPSIVHLASHLQGKKHSAQIQLLNGHC